MSGGDDNNTALIAKGSASDAGHGWYRANVANEDGDQTATVYTNIENTMAKFDVKHTDAAGGGGYISECYSKRRSWS